MRIDTSIDSVWHGWACNVWPVYKKNHIRRCCSQQSWLYKIFIWIYLIVHVDHVDHIC